ncbi:hypothetical protein ABK040_002487 [Willaertia magna]
MFNNNLNQLQLELWNKDLEGIDFSLDNFLKKWMEESSIRSSDNNNNKDFNIFSKQNSCDINEGMNRINYNDSYVHINNAMAHAKEETIYNAGMYLNEQESIVNLNLVKERIQITIFKLLYLKNILKDLQKR